MHPHTFHILQTADGSPTIYSDQFGQTFHSIHGALTESEHVFIHYGLLKTFEIAEGSINLLEMGFGSGLNAFLSMQQAEQLRRNIYYKGIEAFPVPIEMISNFLPPSTDDSSITAFEKLHSSPPDVDTIISPFFTFQVCHVDLLNFSDSPDRYHLIYFDAFAPSAQPELWTTTIFEKLYNLMQFQGILVTYCSKGEVRRAMQSAGFQVTKVPGPKGKREISVARKI